MLIDDSELDIFVHKTVIESLNIAERIQSFTNAVDALNYLKLIEDENAYYRLFAPQLILLDIDMPLMNGFQFLNEFDKLEIFKQKPIDIFIVSSAFQPNDIEATQIKKICSGYFSKPLMGQKIFNYLKEKSVEKNQVFNH